MGKPVLYVKIDYREGGLRKSKLVTFHKWIAQSKMGRKLRRGESIHHKNGNPLDNRPENLEILSIEEHRALHAIKGGKVVREMT